MNPEIQQVRFNQADIAKLLPEISIGIVDRPAKPASPNGNVLFDIRAGNPAYQGGNGSQCEEMADAQNSGGVPIHRDGDVADLPRGAVVCG